MKALRLAASTHAVREQRIPFQSSTWRGPGNDPPQRNAPEGQRRRSGLARASDGIGKRSSRTAPGCNGPVSPHSGLVGFRRGYCLSPSVRKRVLVRVGIAQVQPPLGLDMETQREISRSARSPSEIASGGIATSSGIRFTEASLKRTVSACAANAANRHPDKTHAYRLLIPADSLPHTFKWKQRIQREKTAFLLPVGNRPPLALPRTHVRGRTESCFPTLFPYKPSPVLHFSHSCARRGRGLSRFQGKA